MHTVVSVKNPIGSAITPSPTSFERGLCPRNPFWGRLGGGRRGPLRCSSGLLHVADEGLPLVDRDVGIRDQSGELVGGVTRDEALIAPVERPAAVGDAAAGDRAHPRPPPRARLA